MPYPTGVSLATLTVGSGVSAHGDPTQITVRVRPYFGSSTVSRLVWVATGQPMVDFEKVLVGETNQAVSFQLPHVDQPGFIDPSGAAFTMWSYILDITVSDTAQSRTWTQNVQPLVGQNVIDVDLIADGPLAAPSSAPIPAVLSVNGQTGHVTVTGGPGGGTSLPGGGSVNQALLKNSSTDGDAIWRTLTKALVGLSNVDNTSDANKPVSSLTQAALDAKANTTALATKADLVNGVLPTSQIPALAISDTFVVATQAAMLALTAQRGDIAKRTDVNKAFILAADPASVLANWVELPAGTGNVTSVNGQTGVIVLGKGDVGLANVDNTSDALKPISTATATALSGKAASTHSHVVADLTATGTRNSTTFLRGDGVWAAPGGSGSVASTAVSHVPSGSLESTNVSDALNELAGEKATIDALTTLANEVDEIQPYVRNKLASDFSLPTNNNTSYTGVTGLGFPISATNTDEWEFEFLLKVSSSDNTTDIRFILNAPTGATGFYAISGPASTVQTDGAAGFKVIMREAFGSSAVGDTTLAGFASLSTPQFHLIKGTVKSGGVAGSVQLAATQHASAATIVSVRSGSVVSALKVA